MTANEATTDALAGLADERVYGRVRVTATLPDTDTSTSEPLEFTGHATEIDDEVDDRGRRTVRVIFGSPSLEFIAATGASGFELLAQYDRYGEREQISGRYIRLPPKENPTIQYGKILVENVERVRDDS